MSVCAQMTLGREACEWEALGLMRPLAFSLEDSVKWKQEQNQDICCSFGK